MTCTVTKAQFENINRLITSDKRQLVQNKLVLVQVVFLLHGSAFTTGYLWQFYLM